MARPNTVRSSSSYSSSSSSPLVLLLTIGAALIAPLLIRPTNAIVLTPEEGKCRVLGFFPMEVDEEAASKDPFTRWTRDETRRVSRSMMATATMALEHFHNRNPVLVPELADLPQECNVELQLDAITEHLTRKRAGQIMVEEAPELCAFLGTYDPDVARAMQPTSVALDLPQVIYYTLDQFLTSSKRPSAVGLPPTVLPHTRGLAEYLNDSPNCLAPRKFLQLIYEEAYTSSYFSQCFDEDAAQKFGMTSDKYQDDHLGIIPTQTPEELQRKIVGEVKDTGVKTIFLNKIDSRGINLTAHILSDYDMLTDEYIYIFQPQAIPTDSVGTIFGGTLKDSPLDKLLRGGLILDHHDPFRGAHPETDPFLQLWKSQGQDMVAKILQRYPQFATSGFASLQTLQEESHYFRETMPADYSAFLYDSIIAIGMGACYATTLKELRNDTKPFRNDIRYYNFTGATARVQWGKYKSNRDNDPLKFGIFNIQAVDNGDGTNDYETVITAEWTQEDRWQKAADNIYRDGTNVCPTDLRQEWQANYLSKGSRGFGTVLFVSAAFISISALVALNVYQKDRIVVRSQPLFLAFICLGSLLMACSILTLGMDEQSLGGTITQLGLDCSCVLSVWFFFCGHVLGFGALVSKTRRLDNVMTFRKGNNMSVHQAMIPMAVLIGLTVLILTVWTAVDPWIWDREWIMLTPFETYGSCQSNHFWAFFGPLMAMLVTVEGIALFFVWKTSDVNDDYSDTSSTILAMACQLQAWLLGVPILTVLNNGDNANAVYLGRALLIWIFSVSSVVFVVGKKIYKAILQRRAPLEENHLHVSGIMNTTTASGSSNFQRSSHMLRASSSRSLRTSLSPSTTKKSLKERLTSQRSHTTSYGSNPSITNNISEEPPAALSSANRDKSISGGNHSNSNHHPFSLDALNASLGGMTLDTDTNHSNSQPFSSSMLELLEEAGGQWDASTRDNHVDGDANQSAPTAAEEEEIVFENISAARVSNKEGDSSVGVDDDDDCNCEPEFTA